MIDPALSFEPHRRRLLGLAYRMLGSLAEAEDAVQDAYLRWHAVDRDQVTDPRAFLTTATTRICLDVLRSARARREEYVGPWLPEPVVDTKALAPDAQTELAEDLSIALLLALDRLSPLERAAFLLHDVFDCSFSEVARALDRSEAACRQLASRARTHVREARPRDESVARDRADDATTRHEELLLAFVDAARSGDLDALMSMLAKDARLVADGGGKVQAALNVIDGSGQHCALHHRREDQGVVGRDDVALPARQWLARPDRELDRRIRGDRRVRDRGRSHPHDLQRAQSGQAQTPDVRVRAAQREFDPCDTARARYSFAMDGFCWDDDPRRSVSIPASGI